MKKILSLNVLLAGIVTILFSLAEPWQKAIQYSMSLSILVDPMDAFALYWTDRYAGLTLVGILLTVVGIVLLIRQRKVSVKVDAFSPVLVSVGITLSLIAVLEIGTAYAQYSEYMFMNALSSAIISSSTYYLSLYYSVLLLWMGFLVLGIILIIAGFFAYWRNRRKEQRQAVVEEESAVAEIEPEAAAETIAFSVGEGFALYCTVMDIRGDYALVKYDETGIESEVALALLPAGIDAGDKLKFENYEFIQI